MEQPVTETTQVSSPTSKPGSSNTLKYIFIAFIAVIFVLTLTLVGVVAYKKYSQSKVDSGVKEGEKVLKDDVITVIDSMDFTEFDPTDPLAFIDFDEVMDKAESSSENLEYLSTNSKIEDLTGKTSHQAMEFSFTTKPSYGDDADFDLTMDFYTEYLEGYDVELQKQFQEELTTIGTDYEKLVDILKSDEYQELLEDSAKSKIEGSFDVSSEQNTMSADFEMTQIKGDFFFKLSNVKESGFLNKEDKAQVAKIENKDIKVGIEVFYALLEKLDEQMQTSYNSTSVQMNANLTQELIQVQNGEMNFKDTEYYELLNDQLAGSFDYSEEEDIETIQRVGNPLKNEFKKFVRDTRFFTNYAEVESIRKGSNLNCVSAELDTENILLNAERLMLSILNIAGNDKASELSQDEVKEARQSLKDQFASAQMFKDSVNMEVSTCNDSDSKDFRGFGFTFKSDIPGTKANYKMNFLNVSNDSEYKISTPKTNVDATDDVLNYIETL